MLYTLQCSGARASELSVYEGTTYEVWAHRVSEHHTPALCGHVCGVMVVTKDGTRTSPCCFARSPLLQFQYLPCASQLGSELPGRLFSKHKVRMFILVSESSVVDRSSLRSKLSSCSPVDTAQMPGYMLPPKNLEVIGCS